MPIPACLTAYIPGLGENTLTGYSSYKHQSTQKRQQKSPQSDSPIPDNRDQTTRKLKRNKSAPEPGSGTESQSETPRRANSNRYQSAVRFTSAGSETPTPQNVSPKRY